MASRLPKWLRDIMLAEDAVAYGTPPSLNEVVARAGGVRQPQSTEDFLRSLVRDVQRTEELARRSVDSGYSADANIFGAPVKTIDQGRALGMRNLPGFENLSVEDQIALASALDKGAMLRSMSAVSGEPTITRSTADTIMPNYDVIPSNRIADITRSENPNVRLFGDIQPTMGEAMAALQNKARYARMTGMDPSLPNPPVFGMSTPRGPVLNDYFTGDVIPSDTVMALGDDVTELAKTIRRDQIDSRVMSVQEAADAMRQAELEEAMARSADEVAGLEARAREYDSFPPETVSQMDKAIRSRESLLSGNTERLTGDPLKTIDRMAIEDTPEWDSAEGFSNYWDRTKGADILKGFGLGHLLSYPAVYGIYKAFGPGSKNTAAPEPARSIGLEESMPDEPIARRAELEKTFQPPTLGIPSQAKPPQIEDFEVPTVAVDDMPVISVDEVGMPDEEVLLGPDDAASLAAETVPPPTIEDLDEELRKRGLSGVPSWYVKAMNDPTVKWIDGMPKEQFRLFSDKALQAPIESMYRNAGMR